MNSYKSSQTFCSLRFAFSALACSFAVLLQLMRLISSWSATPCLFTSIYFLSPETFSPAVRGAELTFNHCIYFSLTTITTLGYGDITPASVPVGIWSTLEAATGVFYMAILVARLVSVYRG